VEGELQAPPVDGKGYAVELVNREVEVELNQGLDFFLKVAALPLVQWIDKA
jgi:hypothetical protein